MNSGLRRVRQLYENRGLRAKELKANGKTIIGYLCCYTPVEFITALDLVPYRIQGNMREAITSADAYFETIACPFARSCFDQALKGEYQFLDGLVVPHTCDTIQRLYDIWAEWSRVPYTHFINVPHMVHPASFEFFEKELGQFAKSLERFSGRKLNEHSLVKATKLHNENRDLLKELYELRKPPLISGTEVYQTLIAGMGLPVAEFNGLLREVIAEVKGRQPLPARPRVLVYGSEMDDVAFVQLIEDSGAHVVMDDVCTGSRTFWRKVAEDGDILTRLARRYLDAIPCPRTYRPKQGSHKKDLEERFKYLLDFVSEFDVQGVILYIIRYCDTHELDVPDLTDYLRGNGISVLPLEDEYNALTAGQLRTRIQAFLETLA